MFIRNFNGAGGRYFKKSIAEYLIKKGIPYLSIYYKEDIYVFSETEQLKQVLQRSPLWIKILLKTGGEVDAPKQT